MAQTSQPLDDIVRATDEAKAAVKTIKSISRAITILGNVIMLGQAIALQKWSLVVPTFKALKESVAIKDDKEKKGETAEASGNPA